jgi:ABC-type branched-subunit amino acid transport system substrate-binding protein
MAALGVNTLQRKQWAIAHVNDPYGNSARDALTQELKQLGVEPVIVQSIDQDQSAAASLERFVQSARTAGAEGTYNFDPNGDGLHGYNVVHNENGSWVFVKHVEFPFQE